jgi:hypothetical protein
MPRAPLEGRVLLGIIASWALGAALSCGDSASPQPPNDSPGAGGAAGAGATTAAPSTLVAFSGVRISSDSSQPNFQKADTSIDWGQGPFASVRLVVDLSTTCFPFETWASNPPPSGQNWPADCDAFDRNFEFLLDPPADEATGRPAVELIRAITPFGGPLHLDVDITDFANGLPGAHVLRTTIATWSDSSGTVSGSHGGWGVTTKIEVVPGPAPRRVLAVVPLWNGSQTAETVLSPLSFEGPSGATDARIELRATGHGGPNTGKGCLGPAEEFCRREIEPRVDGATLEALDPYRNDCDELCTIAHHEADGTGPGSFDYCSENPCGAISSVRAPRANWCPGSLTPPFVIQADALRAAGPHTFDWSVSRIEPGGSFRLSATYFAFGP